MSIRITTIFILGAAVLGGCGGEVSPPEVSRPNLLLITLDTLRADHLGCYGGSVAETPVLDGLAKEGVLFLNAVAPVPLTLPSHSSLFTGRYPMAHGVRDNGGFLLADEALTLAEVLQEKGWRTAGFVSAFVLHSRFGVAQGFDTYSDRIEVESAGSVSPDSIQRRGDETVGEALDWLKDHVTEKGAVPFFVWVHLFDPHTPYEPPEPYATQYALDPYAGEVAYSDEQVGRLLDGLEHMKLKEDTLVMVMGDHGEGKGNHKELYHGLFIYDSTIKVPMIFRVPGMAPRKVEGQVRLIDVMPTVLDLTGLEIPGGIAGVSLKPLMTGEKEDLRLAAYCESYFSTIHYGWSELKSLRVGNYKYIQAPTPELFDLASDPTEENNLALSRPDVASRMRENLNQLEERWGTDASVEAAPLDARTSEALRVLGYTGTAAAKRREGETLPDPKDKADLVFEKTMAERMIFGGDPFRAVQILQSVVDREPGMLDARISLGVALHNVEDYDREIALHMETTEMAPDFFLAWVNLGIVLKKTDNEVQAADAFKRALELDPQSHLTMGLLIDSYFRSGKFGKCEKLCRRCLELEPGYTGVRVTLAMTLVNRGRLKKAREEVEKVLETDPTEANAYFTLGKILENLRDVEGAVEAYEKELVHHRGNPNTFESLANLYMKLGEGEKAAEAAREALKLEPNSYMAKEVLKTLQQKAK